MSVDPTLLGPTGGNLGGTETELDMYGLPVDWDASFATLTSAMLAEMGTRSLVVFLL